MPEHLRALKIRAVVKDRIEFNSTHIRLFVYLENGDRTYMEVPIAQILDIQDILHLTAAKVSKNGSLLAPSRKELSALVADRFILGADHQGGRVVVRFESSEGQAATVVLPPSGAEELASNVPRVLEDLKTHQNAARN